MARSRHGNTFEVYMLPKDLRGGICHCLDILTQTFDVLLHCNWPTVDERLGGWAWVCVGESG